MRRSRKTADDSSVGLIPIMNLVCLLIPFLLYTASFVAFAAVSATAPRIVPEAPRDGPPPPEESPVTLLITDNGFHVRTAGGALPNDCGAQSDGPSFPLRPDAEGCVDGQGYPSSSDRAERVARSLGPPVCAYDFDRLGRCVSELKEERPEDQRIVILGEGGVSYDVLIRAMDVTRGSDDEPLFPEVVLGSGVS